MTTDTSEKGLEDLIFNYLIQQSGYEAGNNEDFDREHALDLTKLLNFIRATQPKVYEDLVLLEEGYKEILIFFTSCHDLSPLIDNLSNTLLL
jgi:type I restriction enzyme, R subunit